MRDREGYGQYKYGGQQYKAHRVAYELFVGPIPDDHQIDHLCRNTPCVRPDHLDPVLPIENTRRGRNANREMLACMRGHEYRQGSFYVNKGRRYCLACARIRKGAVRHRKSVEPDYFVPDKEIVVTRADGQQETRTGGCTGRFCGACCKFLILPLDRRLLDAPPERFADWKY